MASVRGLLQNRPAVVVAVLAFWFVAAQSWLGIAKPTAFPRDLVHIFGLAFSIFITTSITYRSPFAGDRVVFGTATAAFVLAGVTAAFSLGPSAISVVAVVESLMWTIAAVASAVVLVRDFMPGRQ